MSSSTCANCACPLTGAYCAQCGQAASAAHPPTIGHLAHELGHELLHVDGAIWRTVTALYLRPGELTREYWAGRRVGWIGPFRVFLIAAAALLVFVPGIGPMNFQTLVQRKAECGFDVSIGAAVERQNGRPGMTPVSDREADAYRAELRRGYSSIRYLAVPIFAAGTWLLYLRRQSFYASHVVLALHFYSFWYTVSVGTSLLPYRLGALLGVGLSAVYLFLALRRLFSESAIRTLAKSTALFAFMTAIEGALAFTSALWVTRNWA